MEDNDITDMNKQLFARFLTLVLLAWGATSVPVLAQDERSEPSDTEEEFEEEPPIECSAPIGITIDGTTIAEVDNWEGLKSELKNMSEYGYFTIVLYQDMDESFGQLTLDRADFLYDLDAELNLNGHKIKGTGISVSGKNMSLKITDECYRQVTCEKTAPYTVTNPNQGGITLTAVEGEDGKLVGGSIEALGGARVLMVSGCVESTNQFCFKAIGDGTGANHIRSYVSVSGGYLRGQAGCVSAQGNGASVTVQGIDDYFNSDGPYLGFPVLESPAGIPVSGYSTNEEGKRLGGTSISLGCCVVIGRSETEGRNAVGVYHPQQGELNINNGATIVAYSVVSGAVAVTMRGGTLYMNDGTIITDGTGNGGYVGEDNNTSYPSMGIMYGDDAGFYDTDNMQVYIYDGIFRGSGGGFSRINELTPLLPSQVISLRGGKYYSDYSPISDDNYYSHPGWVLSLYAADGYGGQMEKDDAADDYYFTFVPEEQAEVVVEEGVVWHFAKFRDALPFYASDYRFEPAQVIKLKSDLTLGYDDEAFTFKAPWQDEDRSYFVLDLNGHTVSSEGRYAFRIAQEAHLKLLDSQGGGVIEGPEYLCYLSPYCELVIESGEYHANRLVALGGSVDDPYYYNEDLGKLTILDGKFRVSFLTNGEDWENLISRFDHCVHGGVYSEYIHPIYKIDPAFVLDENEDDVYHWRVSSAVKAFYGTTKTDVDRADNTYTIWLDGEEGVLADRMTQLLVYNDQTDVNMKVKKNFPSADTWCAFYAPFAIEATAELLQDFDFAKIWDTEIIEGQTTIEFIQLNAGDKIPAFTPCLVRAKADGLQTMTFPNVNLGNTTDARKPIDCSTVREKFTFTGVFENTGVHEKYVLNGAGALVYATNVAAKLTPMKWYMEKESKKPSTSPSTPEQVNIRVLEGETSGITDLSTSVQPTDGKVYTLQGAFIGTSLQGLPAGIYVQNGRKVVVK